jgi:hypothetical protein
MRIFLGKPPATLAPSEAALSLLIVLNALGSSADALALILVLRQVPSSGRLRFQQGTARWSPS